MVPSMTIFWWAFVTHSSWLLQCFQKILSSQGYRNVLQFLPACVATVFSLTVLTWVLLNVNNGKYGSNSVTKSVIILSLWYSVKVCMWERIQNVTSKSQHFWKLSALFSAVNEKLLNSEVVFIVSFH